MIIIDHNQTEANVIQILGLPRKRNFTDRRQFILTWSSKYVNCKEFPYKAILKGLNYIPMTFSEKKLNQIKLANLHISKVVL